LIGTSEYQRLANLPSCAVDVAELAAVLGSREIGAYTEVRTVLDRTAAQVRREVNEFLDSVDPGDLALVYFTGHGLRATRTTGEFFFAAADTEPDRLELTGVRSGFINQLLEGRPDVQRVAILDTCLSGGFVHGFRVRDELPPDTGQLGSKGHAEAGSRGFLVLSSSGPAEVSFAGVGGAGGAGPSRFTEVVVRALRTGLSGAAERGRPISVIALQEYVQEQMRYLQPPQKPLYAALAVDGRIEIADAPRGVVSAGQVSAAPRVPPSPERSEPAELEEPTWPRLLCYFRDLVLAGKSQPRLMDARGAGREFVCLAGSEQLISGDLDDGETAVPDDVTDWLAARDPAAELWTGYPAVVLNEEPGGGGTKFAPLLVRRVELTEWNRLRPYGPVLPNAELARKLLDDAEVELLIDTYEPSWQGGEHGRLALDARALLTDPFGLNCVEELRPERLSPRMDLNSPGQGARNVAVLFTVNADDQYIKGLLKDLVDIEQRAQDIEGTALGLLLRQPASSPPSATVPRLVTPRAASAAQRAVLHSAMTRPLTVATGPPGTGKSQLVTDVIATALANGEKVLLASTNNGAVDEVCEKFAEFAPGGLVRTGSGDNRQIEQDTLELLVGLVAPGPGELATAGPKLDRAMSAVAELDQEFERGARAEAVLARTAHDLVARATELGADLSELRLGLESDPARWMGRARRAGDTSWFAGWRRRRLFRQVGLPEERADQGGCRALAAFAKALNEQRRARPIAAAQRPGHEAVRAIDEANRQVELAATDLVRVQVRASAHAGRRTIDELLEVSRGEKSDWGARCRTLKYVPAWAVTSLSVRRFPPNPRLFDLVVIDEASQCSLSHVLPLLFRARRALIIGDPMQLSAITQLDPVRAERIRRNHRLPANWLEEHGLSATNSAYATAARAADEPALLLDEHYRCHPHIAEAASTLFYRGRWTVLTDTRGRPSLGGPAVVGIDVRGHARRGSSGRSWINPVEAERVAEQVGDLLSALPPEASIGVVAPFAAQARLIGECVISRCGLLDEDRFLSATVHKFQGRQRDIMLFSLTAREEHTSRAMRWMIRQPELWNVAVTRARSHLFIVGDLQLWRARSRVVATLLDADLAVTASGGPWDSQLYATLTRWRQADVRIGVPCNGYRADAVVTESGVLRALLVDSGTPDGVGAAEHRRRTLRRCALLGDEAGRPAERIPAWKIIEGAAMDARLPV